MYKSLINKAVVAVFGSKSTQNSNLENQEIASHVDRPREIMEQFVDGQIRLLELNDLLLENILGHLSVRDLAVFRRTCKTSKQLVDDYLNHYLSSFGRLEKIKALVTDQSSYCFMPSQEPILERMGQNIQLPLKLFFFAQNILIPTETKTFLVEEAEDFCHLGNPQYIIRQWEPSLQRNIVVLRSVCWLKFVKNLGVQPPGCYQVRLRLYVDSSISWPHWGNQRDPAILSVNKISRGGVGEEETRTVLVSESFLPSYWQEIGTSSFDNSRLKHCQVIRDVTSPNWHYIEFEPFVTTDETEMDFAFVDIVNPNWKAGMKWDVLELRPLSNLK